MVVAKGNEMKRTVIAGLLTALLVSASITVPDRAWATDWPLAQGDYWEVTGVLFKEGGGYAYSEWLAKEWKADQEFAKSKGWIKDYKIFGNTHARKGEADLYLVVVYNRLEAGPDNEKRGDEYLAWKKTTSEKMEKESGNRAQFREILSTQLLQEMKIK